MRRSQFDRDLDGTLYDAAGFAVKPLEFAEVDYGSEKFILNLGAMTQDEIEQFSLYVEAFKIYRERQLKYRGLWQEGGWTDSAHHIRSKAARVATLLNGVSSLSDAELYEDDAVDLMNFGAFFVRNVRTARARLPRDADGVKDKEGMSGT